MKVSLSPSLLIPTFPFAPVETKSITHYQYLSWPDLGAPTGTLPLRIRLENFSNNRALLFVSNRFPETDSILEMMHLVDLDFENHGKNEVPIVHCSAGVGRTGTWIALCILMRGKGLGTRFFRRDLNISSADTFASAEVTEARRLDRLPILNVMDTVTTLRESVSTAPLRTVRA